MNLQKQGMQALVLDLRNNPGGLLNVAVDVCAQFVPPNTKVVSTQGRVASQQHEYCDAAARQAASSFPDGGSGERRERQRSGDRGGRVEGFEASGPGR